MTSAEQFEMLFLLAYAWAQKQEQLILHEGVPLTPNQVTDAAKIGVLAPERVRLLRISSIPDPEHPVLRKASEEMGLISPQTAGLSLGYGIFIRADCWGNRELLFHELVHTSQCERLGGLQPFLRQYLHECATVGYPAAPMEREAAIVTAGLRLNHGSGDVIESGFNGRASIDQT
jgi:hypothetical protein